MALAGGAAHPHPVFVVNTLADTRRTPVTKPDPVARPNRGRHDQTPGADPPASRQQSPADTHRSAGGSSPRASVPPADALRYPPGRAASVLGPLCPVVAPLPAGI